MANSETTAVGRARAAAAAVPECQCIFCRTEGERCGDAALQVLLEHFYEMSEIKTSDLEAVINEMLA